MSSLLWCFPFQQSVKPRSADGMLSGTVRGEFTIYPFVGGDEPPPHVQAAIDDSAGDVEASFGDFDAGGSSRTEIALPEASKVLRLEFDVEALEAVQRM